MIWWLGDQHFKGVQGLGALLQAANPLSGVLTAPPVVPPVGLQASGQATAPPGLRGLSPANDWLQQVQLDVE